MKESFPEAIEQTFRFEGVYSQDKAGGPTLYGISSRYWPKEYTIISGMIPTDALQYAREFYRKNFWNLIGCDGLAHPLDCVAFDSAVNPGPGWASATLRITKDWRRMLDLRETYYEERARHDAAKKQFLKGWENRCATLRAKYKEAS